MQPKQSKTLPTVRSQHEVAALLQVLRHLETRTLFSTSLFVLFCDTSPRVGSKKYVTIDIRLFLRMIILVYILGLRGVVALIGEGIQ